MRTFYPPLVLLMAFTLTADLAVADQSRRVDVSPDFGRRDNLSRESENWKVQPGPQSTFSENGISMEIEPIKEADSELLAFWWKGGLVHNTSMASDCVYVEGDGAGLQVTIQGLSDGKHSLVTYHNSIWDEDVGPVDVYVDGSRVASAVQPSRKVTDDADAASAFAEFDVDGGQPVVVQIRPHEASERGREQTLDRVVLNGLEFDTVNPAKKALKPNPAHADEHVSEEPVLTWRAPESAVAHDVYLGTDYDAVKGATRSSPEYQGRQRQPRFRSDADDSFATYYWRVDEVYGNAPEQITAGDVWRFRIRSLAFPGAEGYGRFARGGRGGRVIEVTNLNDSGPGSLRAAVEAHGPRTVVFNVGGLITLESRLIVHNRYITIAGQTAPGKGICVRKFNMGLGGARDAIVRYVRVRPGDISGATLDGMGMASCDHCIIDHCSISWSHDEAFSSRNAKNITLQRTLISEALNVAGHRSYRRGKQHGYAASISGDIGSFHHNLLAHCAGRNWSLAGGLNKAAVHAGRLDIRNNVVYNWGHRTTDGGAMEVNFVNNYYKPGPASRVFHVLKPERNHHFGPQNYFVAGNVMEGRYYANKPFAGVVAPRREPMDNFIVDRPFFEPHVRTQSAEAALENVLNDVGCNIPMLDEHDKRVIEETRNGTTTYQGSVTGYPGLPDSQEDVGGWDDYPEVHRSADWDTDHDGMPNEWEKDHKFDPNDASDGSLDADGDGYTNLEEYLNRIRPTKDTRG